MRPSLIAFILAVNVCAIGPSRAQDNDPIARAQGGVVECFSPNTLTRTCAGMSAYRILDDGKIASDQVVLIQNHPLVILSGTSIVYMRDGMVCDRVEQVDIDSARFTIDGAPAPADVAQSLRNALAASLSGIDELCARYTPEADGARVTVFADGVERPDLSDHMIWVRREDGCTVGVADASPT